MVRIRHLNYLVIPTFLVKFRERSGLWLNKVSLTLELHLYFCIKESRCTYSSYMHRLRSYATADVGKNCPE